MKLPIRLTFAVLLAYRGLAAPLPVRQDQVPSQPQANQEQPTANAPAQSTTPAPAQTASPSAQMPAPDLKAGPPPKPPVLKHRKRKPIAQGSSSAHKKKPAHKSTGDHGKVIVRNGGAKEGSAQLTPALSPGQAQNERASTANLLAVTDANLKRVAGRQLTPAQQGMVDEIRSYMRQAKAAAASADTNRAQTLAYKARLLSDELARK
jgi:hypothetical protein